MCVYIVRAVLLHECLEHCNHGYNPDTQQFRNRSDLPSDLISTTGPFLMHGHHEFSFHLYNFVILRDVK